MARECSEYFLHTLTFDGVSEGTQRKTVQCPSPQYRGSMTASCAANLSTWTDLEGVCEHVVCLTEWRNISVDNRTWRVRLPQQEPSDSRLLPDDTRPPVEVQETPNWSVVPCCGNFSNGGSCVDPAGGYGFMISGCRLSREGSESAPVHEVWNASAAAGPAPTPTQNSSKPIRCTAMNEMISGVRMDHTRATAETLYRTFAKNAAAAVHKGSEGQWVLPPSGVMTSISVAMRGTGSVDEWRPVASKRYVASAFGSEGVDTTSIDTTVPDEQDINLRFENHKKGLARPAAAFADTACRQLGYRRAAFATNCRAIHEYEQLLQQQSLSANTEWELGGNKGQSIFAELCPGFGASKSQSCPAWLQVGESPTGQQAIDFAAWLEMTAHNRLNPENYSLTRINPDARDNNRPLSPPLPPFSTCSGTESDLRQCFWSQAQEVLRVLATGGAAQEYENFHRLNNKHKCMRRMIVGCTDAHSDPALIAASAAAARQQPIKSSSPRASDDGSQAPEASPQEGTWVLGDKPGAAAVLGNLQSPKIFTALGGPYNCTTGERMTDASVVSLAADSKRPAAAMEYCWGRLLDPAKNWP